MLSPLALSVVFFAVGAILGIYLPLALAYVVNKSRGTQHGMQLVWKVTLRLVATLFLYLLLFGIFGYFSEGLQLEKQSEIIYSWLGLGAVLGFVAGGLLFFVGLRKGRAHAASGQTS
jgi:ribose/xylose/arabinose/galactoside ABC-type transport system permease subunit